MDLKNLFTDDETKMNWGSAYTLWDYCRYKVIGIPVLDMMYEKASDPELKSLIKNGIDYLAMPHIEKIQEYLQEQGLASPPLPQRNRFGDEEIAKSIREVLRFGLVLGNHSVVAQTRRDGRKLAFDIFTEDHAAFDKIVDLKTKKNWLFTPPVV